LPKLITGSGFHVSVDVTRDELIVRHMPLARRIAARYRSPDGYEDLEQVAYLGLVKAAMRYDPSRGTTFLTYAIPTITGEIKKHFRDTTWAVHVPRAMQNLSLKVLRATEELAAELGRTPSVDDIARRLNLDREAVLDAMEAAGARDTRSFDEPLRGEEESGATVGDGPACAVDDAAFEAVAERDVLRRCLETLGPREREAIRLRFFDELTQSQIGERLGVSQMAISRLLRRTLAGMHETALAAR
jgi:RNA polymerase sigma-B factor